MSPKACVTAALFLSLSPALATGRKVEVNVVRAPDCPMEVFAAKAKIDQDGAVDFHLQIKNVGNEKKEKIVAFDIEVRAETSDNTVLSTQQLSVEVRYPVAKKRKENVPVEGLSRGNWRTERYTVEILRVWFDRTRSWQPTKRES